MTCVRKTDVHPASRIGSRYYNKSQVLMFVSKENCETTADWEKNHERLILDTPNHSMKILNGGHYLHLDCQDEVAGEILKTF